MQNQRFFYMYCKELIVAITTLIELEKNVLTFSYQLKEDLKNFNY